MPAPDSPLFSSLVYTTPNAQSFRKRLSALLSLLGLQSEDFLTHSLRRGGATWLLNSGAPLHLIKVLGDWKSDSVLKYLKPDVNDSLKAINKFASKGF